VSVLAINVKAEDITGATRVDPCNCPIARAIKRQMYSEYRKVYSFTDSHNRRFDYSRPFNVNEASHVAVKTEDVRIPLTGEIALPEIACRFIDRYDNKLPVKPFAFTVEVSEATALLFKQPLALPERAHMALSMPV